MSEALVKQGPFGLARPDFIKEGDVRGTENITSNDIRPPALRIAQSMSPERKRTEPTYIQGLEEGQLFNSITREIYGEGPVEIVIVNQLGHRHVEFAPMSEGGGVIDFNVPDGDPRTDFTEGTDENGKKVRRKPRATKFYDYLVLVVVKDREPQLMTLSLKSTQLKVATKINTLVKLAKMPSFALRFTGRTVPDKKGIYSFFSWSIEPAGYVTEEVYNEASRIYDAMRTKTVVIETENAEPVNDEDIPF